MNNRKIIIPGEQKTYLQQIEVPNELENLDIQEIVNVEPSDELTSEQISDLLNENVDSVQGYNMSIRDYVENKKFHDLDKRAEIIKEILVLNANEKIKVRNLYLKVEARKVLYPLFDSPTDTELARDLLERLDELEEEKEHLNKELRLILPWYKKTFISKRHYKLSTGSKK